MVISMLLAHLVGDFILQWDDLARWKACSIKGVTVHALIVLIITALFALPFKPFWWQGVLIISLAHLLIDTFQFYVRLPLPPLARFFADQTAHYVIIFAALLAGGYLTWPLVPSLVASANETPRLTLLLGYAFVTMPAWVLLKFAVYGVVRRSAPNFVAAPDKYLGIAERILVTTVVLVAPLVVVPLVAVPTFIFEWTKGPHTAANSVFVTEFVASIGLASMVGLALRLVTF